MAHPVSCFMNQPGVTNGRCMQQMYRRWAFGMLRTPKSNAVRRRGVPYSTAMRSIHSRAAANVRASSFQQIDGVNLNHVSAQPHQRRTIPTGTDYSSSILHTPCCCYMIFHLPVPRSRLAVRQVYVTTDSMFDRGAFGLHLCVMCLEFSLSVSHLEPYSPHRGIV